MTRKLILAALVLAAPLGAASALAQDAAKGKQLYEANCARCHAVTNQAGTGPGLAGVVGRKSGDTADFAYSRAMRRADLTWSDQTLEEYLSDPVGRVPGNKMPYSGLPTPAERADVIAYLKTLK
ncbi:c-type cytochrome [Arenibaculum pallidiluteum]|uniref:c-type cytochrome n=1 Tax=Arenibaculum pallidiluteum TaxID=2812559 RepID=UPI001A97328E|nr:c-type cytochrome [Arenibaculum pallidiluteum]